MWRDIAMANRKNLSRALSRFMDDLRAFRRALKRGDDQAVSAFFERAKRRRDLWAASAGSPSPE